MRVVYKKLEPAKVGSVQMTPLDVDDLWHAQKLIAVGDTCTAETYRKVQLGNGGRSCQEKALIELEVLVLNVEFDEGGPCLRVKGKVLSKNDAVNIGAFHTLEIEQNRPFVLRKDAWDSVAIEHIHERANHEPIPADLAVVLVQDGLATISLIGEGMKMTKCTRVEYGVARRTRREKSMNKFFEKLMEAFIKEIDFKVIRCVVIASPPHIKERFLEYLLLESEREMIRDVTENKSKIILAYASSGSEHSLKEILQSPEVMKKVKDTKAAKEVKILNDFFSFLSNDACRVCYGPKQIDLASEEKAIQNLLIMEELLKSPDFNLRQKYVDLVGSVKACGGAVHMFSSIHPSGKQLEQITGVAAILRFPLYDIDDLEIVI